MTWQNWSRTVRMRPGSVARPADDSQAATVLAEAGAAGLRVRPVGSGHSFTPLVATSGVLLRLDGLRGLRSVTVDATGGAQVTVGAGTTIRELNTALAERGFGLANMGDVDVQTISGAISTGTHGTGRGASLSAAVTAVRLARPDGSVADVDALRDPDLFQAARLGLGALGVITAVTVRAEHAFTLRAAEESDHLDAVLDRLPGLATDEEHVEFYWLPFTETVQLKRNRRTGEQPRGSSRLGRWWSNEVIENGGVALVQRVTRALPRTTPLVNQAAGRLISRHGYVDDAPAVFTRRRRVRFHEMEYALPLAAAVPALRELRELTLRGPWRIAFPVEVRFAPADDVWLSPAYGRDTVYIATHAYPRTDYRGWFDAVERLWASYSGRPHWGKLHSRDARYLRDHYDRWDAFRATRDRVDPSRILANDHLDEVLGP